MSAPSSDSAAIRQVVRALRAADYGILDVDNGDGPVALDTEADIIEEATAADEATMRVSLPNGGIGWIFFVLGNDPEEVVCDHSVNLSPVLDALTDGWW